MDKNWAEETKLIHKLLSNKNTYKESISRLITFRKELFNQIEQIVNNYPEEAFYQMPFINANGFHNKTLSYSIWHIFRIEDIVTHELIAKDTQIIYTDDFLNRINSPIITTGNELIKQEIADFSKLLNTKELLEYARTVMKSTDSILDSLDYTDLKKKFSEEDRKRLIDSKCISEDENARWLIEYWCSKDIRGLIKMPFSRHWVLHIEAMRRIKNELCKRARKGIDPVACCGFSCNHCFLSEWCGSCRSIYNTCSNATISEDHICPNVKCCEEKGIDGCYECENLENCTKGYYKPANDGASAAKAQAMYIRKYGKKEFLKVHDRLHQKFDFQKTQEILGQDMYKGLSILEEN